MRRDALNGGVTEGCGPGARRVEEWCVRGSAPGRTWDGGGDGSGYCWQVCGSSGGGWPLAAVAQI